MESNFFNNLRGLLEKLPGIGPRQANRFLWALLDFSEEDQAELSKAISGLPRHLRRCSECFRAFSVKSEEKTCSFCAPGSVRDKRKIMILEKDSDLLNVERAGIYDGTYHILGGMIDPLEEKGLVRERIKKLHGRVKEFSPEPEVILALSPTKLGEFTSNYVVKVLEPLKCKTTRLARGLSTGTELEYADEVTLRNALDNRR